MNVLDWEYKAEGIGNIIVSYKGEKQEWKGKCLRIRKVMKFEAFLQKDSKENERQQLVHWFVKQVMHRLVEKEVIDAGELIPMSFSFLEQLENYIQPKRPSHRQKEPIDKHAKHALLISDYTHIRSIASHLNEAEKEVFCVEIKPKYGILLKSFHSDTKIKTQVCRYCMQQYLKWKQGKIKQISKFCPMDLFSNSPQRVSFALHQLLENPQNNCKIFCNEQLIWSEHSTCTSYKEYLEELLIEANTFCPTSTKDKETILSNFVQVLQSILFQSKIMQRIQKIQLLDKLDVEMIIHVYQHLTQKFQVEELHHLLYNFTSTQEDDNSPNHWTKLLEMEWEALQGETKDVSFNFACKKELQNTASNDTIQHDFQHPWLQKEDKNNFKTQLLQQCEQNDQFAIHLVRAFLISQAAKDCSVMISFYALEEKMTKEEAEKWITEHHNSKEYVFVEEMSRLFHFKVSIVDLDPKNVSKIPHYIELDKQIVNQYKESVVQQ